MPIAVEAVVLRKICDWFDDLDRLVIESLEDFGL